jgi:hypothetical protein
MSFLLALLIAKKAQFSKGGLGFFIYNNLTDDWRIKRFRQFQFHRTTTPVESVLAPFSASIPTCSRS